MPPKIITKTNFKKRSKNSSTTQKNVQHLESVLNEDLVTVTTSRQPISSSSSTQNKRTTAENTNETFDQDESIDSMDEDNMDLEKSEVWQYAKKLSNGKAKCHNCHREFSCKDHNTTGIRRHVARCMNISKFTSISTGTLQKSMSHDMQKKLHELVYKCIIEDGRNFGDFRKPGMIRFLREVVSGYKPPTRRTVQRQLKRLQKKYTRQLVTELKSIDTVSITTDLWSDRQLNSYLCLTGHYLNSESKLNSTVLSFTTFPERHTGEAISQTIKNELKRLQIYEKTRTITCDGAANIRKSFQTLKPKRINCLAHKLHLTVCNALCLWVKQQETSSSANDEENERNDSNESYGSSNRQSNTTNEMSTESDEAADDDNDDDDDDDDDDDQEGDEEGDDDHSSSEEKSDTPEDSNETSDIVHVNWEEGVVEHNTSITCIAQYTIKLLNFELNRQEWGILEQVEEILGSFADATTLISGKQYSTIGLGYVAVTSIKDYLEEKSGNNETDQLKALLYDQLIHYFENDSDQYELLKYYAFYDPVGFGVLDRRDRTKIEREIKDLHKEYTTSTANTTSSNVVVNSRTTSQSRSSTLQRFLTAVGKSQSNINKEDTNLSIANELSVYRSLALQEYNDVASDKREYDPFMFWRLHESKLKFLSTLARQHLIVPCTSVPSESTFSIAAYIGRKERNRLTPENLCTLVFLKDKISK